MDEEIGVGVGSAERAPHAGRDGSTPTRRRRMSAGRKREAVLRLLRGEDLELVSRELGVTAAELSGWREAFLAAGERDVAAEPAHRRPARRDRPAAGQGRRADDDHRASRGQDRAAGDGEPFGPPEVEAMSRRASPSTSRTYGIERVARLWRVSRATLYRHRRSSGGERRRPGPEGAMSDEALVEAIRKLLRDSPFHGEGHRKLWARLRFAGVRTSRRRVLRLTREHGLLAHQRAGRPHGPRAHDGTITTERVDLMWGADLTSVMTGEGQAAVFVTVDHCSTGSWPAATREPPWPRTASSTS